MATALVLPETSPVRHQFEDGIAILTLDHAERRNALSRAMLAGLKSTLAEIGEDKKTRVVILRDAGNVFSSGHDLRELESSSREECAALFARCTEVMEAMRNLPQPVIAQVQGL